MLAGRRHLICGMLGAELGDPRRLWWPGGNLLVAGGQ
jgi:hypothetical protein